MSDEPLPPADELPTEAAPNEAAPETAHDTPGFRAGFVAVVGRPNVGKSSLFNALVGAERAIVTEAPGTTRDVLTERLDVGGLHVTLLDTAGIREARDVAEREGVVRSLRARATADSTLVVLDAQAGLTAADESLLKEAADAGRRIVVWNKCDLLPPGTGPAAVDGVNVSALTGQGLDRLRACLAASLLGSEPRSEPPAVANIRHVELLERVLDVLTRARRHMRYRALLELWLYIHVPMTFALLAALIAHVVSVFYFW